MSTIMEKKSPTDQQIKEALVDKYPGLRLSFSKIREVGQIPSITTLILEELNEITRHLIGSGDLINVEFLLKAPDMWQKIIEKYRKVYNNTQTPDSNILAAIDNALPIKLIINGGLGVSITVPESDKEMLRSLQSHINISRIPMIKGLTSEFRPDKFYQLYLRFSPDLVTSSMINRGSSIVFK